MGHRGRTGRARLDRAIVQQGQVQVSQDRISRIRPIQNAFHALAIDERRKPFAPDIWEKPAGWAGQLEQAWFAGVHSNVGGSYAPDGLANEALHWIVEKAEKVSGSNSTRRISRTICRASTRCSMIR